MFNKLLPREEQYFTLFAQMTSYINDAAKTLVEMLSQRDGDYQEYVQRIKSIDNTDQNVARVEFVQGSDFRQVMVLGGAQAGISKLTLTDENNNQEVYTILVELNTEFLRRVIAQTALTSRPLIQASRGVAMVRLEVELY